MSKGSKPRPYDPKAFAAGYDRIFGKKAEPPCDKSDPEFVTEKEHSEPIPLDTGTPPPQ